jgi:small-conductance mechanosensitive channel
MRLRVLHRGRTFILTWLLTGLIVGLVSAASWGLSPAASPSPQPSSTQSATKPSVAPKSAATGPALVVNQAQSAAAKPSAVSSRAAVIAPTPVPLSEQQNVVSFVGSAIAWYRQLNIETGLVEEPSEEVSLTADQGMAEEIINLAFDYADAQAALITKFGQAGQPAASTGTGSGPAALVENRLAAARGEMNTLQAQVKDLSARLRTTPRRQKDSLARQLVAAQAEQELAQSRVDFLTTMTEFERGNSSASQTNSLQAQIDALRHSLQPEAKPKAQPAATAPIREAAEPTGLVGLVEHLFALRSKITTIEQRQDGTRSFVKVAARARTSLEKALKSIDDSAQQLTQLALSNDATNIADRKKQFEQLIARRKLLGTALVALTKQNLLLRRYEDNLAQWRAQVLGHSNQVLHALLVRVGGLLLVVFLIAALSFIWRRLAFRYVEDVTRRRQILKVRDVTVVILVIIVLLFNFTSELGALATVVGFAAAGIAVALQDVIMSIAGYFRLSGRFGIKHGDRVELQGVRGEVVELGLTKLTLLELGGDAIQSGPTGRLVMIPNSSVFRDKFLNHPGHSLIIWRELRFTLSPDCDFRVVEKQLLEVVEAVFARYRDSARSQLQEMERNLNTRVDSSRPQSRVRLQPEGLQITLRFPVDVRSEAQVVDEISRRLLDYIAREPGLRFVPSGTPNIQMVVVAAAAEDPNHAPADAPEGSPTPVPAPRNQP